MTLIFGICLALILVRVLPSLLRILALLLLLGWVVKLFST